MSKKQYLKIADLYVLFSEATRLIGVERRSDEMVAELQRALRLFQENRLAKVSGRKFASETEQLQWLSSEINSLALCDSCKTDWKKRGFRFIGEVLTWWKSDIIGQHKFEDWDHTEEEILLVAQDAVGLNAAEFPRITNTWKPPYLSDATFLAAIHSKLGSIPDIDTRLPKLKIKFPIEAIKSELKLINASSWIYENELFWNLNFPRKQYKDRDAVKHEWQILHNHCTQYSLIELHHFSREESYKFLAKRIPNFHSAMLHFLPQVTNRPRV